MADFESMKETILRGTPRTGRERVDVIRDLLTKNTTTLRGIAKLHGDTDLQKLCACTCLNRLRRMAAVNSNESSAQSSFLNFKNTLLGSKK